MIIVYWDLTRDSAFFKINRPQGEFFVYILKPIFEHISGKTNDRFNESLVLIPLIIFGDANATTQSNGEFLMKLIALTSTTGTSTTGTFTASGAD